MSKTPTSATHTPETHTPESDATASRSKHLLYVFRSAPYDTHRAAEGLDALLASALFDQRASVLFLGEGVWQLLKTQQTPQNRPGKNHQKMLQALPLYDIENLFVHAPSLATRGLAVDALNLPAQVIDDSAAHALMNTADHILSF